MRDILEVLAVMTLAMLITCGPLVLTVYLFSHRRTN